MKVEWKCWEGEKRSEGRGGRREGGGGSGSYLALVDAEGVVGGGAPVLRGPSGRVVRAATRGAKGALALPAHATEAPEMKEVRRR